MSRIDRYPLPSEQEFELVAERYIVVPGALWGVAMLVALLAALTQPEATRASPTDPAAAAADGSVLGA
jgi:hypothetical protein